jgi:hypothetical protein
MRRLFRRVALVLYPRRWRERYGQELQDLLDDLERNDGRSRAGMMLNLIAGAAETRARALRAPLRSGAALAVVTVALGAVAVVTVFASGRSTGGRSTTELQANSGPTPVVTSGSRVSYGNPSREVEHQLQTDIQTLCRQLAVGKRATAIEMNPTTGAIVGKIVQTCGRPA